MKTLAAAKPIEKDKAVRVKGLARIALWTRLEKRVLLGEFELPEYKLYDWRPTAAIVQVLVTVTFDLSGPDTDTQKEADGF